MVITYFDDSPLFKGVYHDTEEPCDAARAFKMVHEEKAREAFLLIHGYTGYPGELVSIAGALYARGYDVFCPRLPGMGTTSYDFQNTGAKDWMGLSENALLLLMGSYAKVHILAHSMGCLIAMILSTRYDVASLILQSPALKFRNKVRFVTFGSYFKRTVRNVDWKSDPSYHLHYEGAPKDDLYLGVHYWSHFFPVQYREMMKLVKKAKSRLYDIDVPTLVLMGTEDPVVEPSSVSLFETRIRKGLKVVMIKGGTHMLFYDRSEKCEQMAINETLSFLSLLS